MAVWEVLLPLAVLRGEVLACSTTLHLVFLQPVMGHSHSHNSNDKDHDHDHDHDAEAANLFGALFGGAADPGSRITLIGLAANIGLSLVKAVAGVYVPLKPVISLFYVASSHWIAPGPSTQPLS